MVKEPFQIFLLVYSVQQALGILVFSMDADCQ